jgi:hypothetical protein
MDGLLAIIETILVLSLTYIALATAASALSGTGMRLVRLRARGLRSMIEYLYRNNVIPLLERLDADYVASGLGSQGKFADLRQRHKDGARPDSLCQFVVDMTFLPLISTGNGETDPRVAKVKSDDWFSLADSQEGLTLEEFRQRLAESELGQSISAVIEKDLDRLQDVKIEFERLTKQFDAQQNGATNWFARAARVWSISFGFLIAIGLNVDSVDLFGTYLSDPSLRRDVLERQEEILSDAEKGAISKDPTAVGTATRAEEALAAATEKTGDVRAALAKIRDSELLAGLSDAGQKREIEALLSNATALTEQTSEVLSDSRDYVQEVRQTTAILTAQFPVGWDRFPGCEKPGADRRCLLSKEESSADGKKWIAYSFSERLNAMPGEHIKWLLGVLVTGFLVGLGAPFWVEVFNNMLRARNLVTDLRSTS